MDSTQSFIDLRSDVFTKAPKQMLEAMRTADIRNSFSVDCIDDVACTKFQQHIAQMFGKQSALFFPTEKMANLASVMLHTSPGSQIIISSNSYAIEKSNGSFALFAGVLTRQVVNNTGLFTAEQVKKRTRKQAQHVTYPNTDLIFIENGTQRGRAWSLQSLKQIKNVAQSLSLKVHIDGTRIFNALAHYKLQPLQISDCFDTMTICLTKGLGCPIGAIVLGSTAEIVKIKSIRKALGGGLWHPGLLTAAATYSLQHILPEISKDNEMAKLLAQQLSKIEGINLNPSQTDINIVYWAPKSENFDHHKFVEYLSEHKIKVLPFDEDYGSYRLVTYYHIRQKEVQEAVKIIRGFFQKFIEK